MKLGGNIHRRKAMKWMVGGIASSVGAILTAPALLAVFSPLIKRPQLESQWSVLGDLNDFPIGEMSTANISQVNYMTKGVYVWRQSSENLVVYSRSCTDLGCPVKWEPGSQVFLCPCHGGMFSKEGERMAGPPKLPLYRYSFRIQENKLEIDLSSVPLIA
jgi:menaquinol-cytochrome c reductase iron-sulfur subunit